MRRGRRPALAAVAVASALVTPAYAQGVNPSKLAEVKAAFLLNFVHYTTWPESSFSDPAAPLGVVILGDDLLAEQLQQMAQRTGPLANGRLLEVIRLDAPWSGLATDEDLGKALDRAHVLYIGGTGATWTDAVLPRLAGRNVLTVGEGRGFAESGGMLGLWRDGERVVFDANPGAIRSARLGVSARLLKLANVVESGSGGL